MRRIFEKNINTPERYDEIYGDHNRLKIDVPDEEDAAKRWTMVKYLEDGMKIIELGCGNSDLLIRIKKEFPNCQVYGLDFSPLIIEYLKNNTTGINYEVGNALKTRFEDGYFDYVVAGELLEHTENPKDLVREMARICKKDGTMAVSTPFVETTWRDPYAEHLWEFDRQDMIDLFSPYGFTEMKIFLGKGRHHVAICRRKEPGSTNPYYKFPNGRPEKQIIAKELEGKEFENILELGCQWGENLSEIQKKYPNKELRGFDINVNVINEAKGLVEGIELEYGDINQLDIPDKSYDVVFTEAVLCMMTPKEMEHALKETIRIARKYIFLVELYDTGNRIGYIGMSGRLVANYEQILNEFGLKFEKRKITKEEWNAEPWITYGYLFTITL
jgi:ubiquinone/menaquinone biosynthesis C-methylase UbiE